MRDRNLAFPELLVWLLFWTIF